MSKGGLIGKILDMSEAARMARAKEMGYGYSRASQSSDSPINKGVGHAMFVQSSDPFGKADDLSRLYGPSKWVATGAGAVDVKDIQKDIIKAIRSRGISKEYGTTAAAIARDASPEDIVNSAGVWDNPELVQVIWDDVLEPRGISSVRTPDGLILFDKGAGGARSVDAAFDPEKKGSSSLMAGLSGAAPTGVGLGALFGGHEEARASTIADRAAFIPRGANMQIGAPQNPRLAAMADMAGQYNQQRQQRTPHALDFILPAGEMPEEYLRKLGYGQNIGWPDRIGAILGLL